jgi:putative holliday junction resolvase
VTENRILAIDYGKKRVGLAITDPLNMFAYPYDTLANDNSLQKNILAIIEEMNVGKIIVGDPVREDGKESVVKKDIDKFVEELAKKVSIDIEFVDERYTSELAKQRIIQSVPSKKKRRDKGLIDKNAAAIMLEDYMRENM